MEAISIEILNPKALQLIKGMQALHLIKISKGRVSRPKALAKKKKPLAAENEELLWKDLSAKNFLKGYGENEPEYTEADIKEANPEYKAWKGK